MLPKCGDDILLQMSMIMASSKPLVPCTSVIFRQILDKKTPTTQNKCHHNDFDGSSCPLQLMLLSKCEWNGKPANLMCSFY